MAHSQASPRLGLILVLVGLLLVAILGMWVYMSTIGARLHQSPQEVPSVTNSAPSPKAAGAVEQARRIVRARLTEDNLPGLSVAVGIGADIVWAEGFGFADLRTNVPVTPNHRFRIGTASTVLTSAAAALLLEDGRLKLDEQIRTYVPAFPQKQWPVTLRNVMGHTAGIVSDSGDEGPLFGEHCERPVEALPHFGEKSLLFEPGTRYRYSDYGWILVSAAVEATAAQPFLTFMQERIFKPLGMRDTVPDPAPVEADDDHPLFNLIREKLFDPRTRRKKTSPDSANTPMQHRVTSYFPKLAADPAYGLHLMRPLDLSCYAGSSVFLSTPSDLVRFAMAINSGKLLKPATVQLLQTSQRLASGTNTDYGLGWDIETVTLAGRQTRVVGHDGELLGGMASSLVTVPDHGIVVSVMSNISYADTFSLAVKIADAFAEQGKNPASK
jgi:serine beta-lactamase-like protein LACTB, mitochondrial